MNRARCAYQGIELADLTEHSTYGRRIVDIDLEIAGASANSDQIMVNSLHWQGVRTLAPPLDVEATAPDGVVEAFSVRGAKRFAVGVQWHPEWKVMNNEFSRALFAAFGKAAYEHAGS